jgi:chemotaxis signal transduction protein
VTTASAPQPASAARAQRIRCGPLVVAVPYAWARGVVEDATLVSVPNAPPWLAGAANVEGRIVAVVDLQAWVDPAAPMPAGSSRLLLGGDGDDRVALRFQGLPQMMRLDADTAGDTAGDTTAATPPAPAPELAPSLAAFVTGIAGQGADAAPLIDLPALTRHWVAELAA